MGKADLHIHSSVSDGMASVPDIMHYVQENTDLDLIAIADHDQVDGALQAAEWVKSHPDCRFRVVVATEITTALGRHLLAYFFRPPYPTEPFPRGKSYRHTIGLVHEMGGLVAIPHPTVLWTPSGGYRHILWLLGAGVRIDGIEVCNAAIGARGNTDKIRVFNRRDFHLGELGGSDAHHLAQIGSAFTYFKGRSPQDFERCLLHRKTKARFGEAGTVTVGEHLRQLFKSWVEKPTRGLRATLANR
ncbi:MAG: PHP-associated domain-containing protein [Sphingomonadaceae bacterium]